jgi:HSP90 family molecular chaperone
VKMRERADDVMFGDLAEVLYGYALLAEGSELNEPMKFNQALIRVLGKV